jgi:hypothetical protein
MPKDISEVRIAHHEALALQIPHPYMLDLYRIGVVEHALGEINWKIDHYHKSSEDAAPFIHSNYVDLHQSALEGFLLTIQSMWERSVRNILVACATKLNYSPKSLNDIRRSPWSEQDKNNLEFFFEELIGLPIRDFDSGQDLLLLHVMGSALRHGDGPASKRLFALQPGLWQHWLAPGANISGINYTVPMDAPAHPSVSLITIPEELLRQMMMSVNWFWEDMDYIRCRSFVRMHESTSRYLRELEGKRLQRPQQRVWTPASVEVTRSRSSSQFM